MQKLSVKDSRAPLNSSLNQQQFPSRRDELSQTHSEEFALGMTEPNLKRTFQAK